MFKTLLPLAVAGLLLSSIAAMAGPWSYTDSLGNVVSLDETPTRIIASQDAAAGLIPLGIRPIAIYADSTIAEAKALQGLDLTGIEILSEVWGEVDIEKAATLDPDLIIAEYWPLEGSWSGGKDVSVALSALAPLTGPTQGKSVLTLIEDYEALAASLGADLDSPAIAADKAGFEAALVAFKAQVAAKPGLTALAVWPGTDALYVAATAGSSELMDFAAWGLNLITPKLPTIAAIGKPCRGNWPTHISQT